MTPKQIGMFAIGPVGTALLGFITLPLSTWLFAKDDIGRISMLFVTCQFTALLFSFGLDQTYVRNHHESTDRPKLLKQCMLPGILVISLLLIAIQFVSPTLLSEQLFGIDSVSFSATIALILFAQFLMRFLSLILRMEVRGLAYSISQLAPKIIIVVTLAAYYFLGLGQAFYLLLNAQVYAYVAVVFMLLLNTRQQLMAAIKANFEITSLKPMLSYGMPLVLGSAAYWGLTTVDKIFLKELTSFEELGLYAVAISFSSAANTLKTIFATVWAPIVYKWANDTDAALKINRVTEWVSFVTLGILCIVGACSWMIDYILPSQYTEVKYLVILCMCAPMLYMFSETTVIGLNVTRKTGFIMLASVIALISNCIGNYLLIPKFGAQGAAVSTALSFMIFTFLRTEFAVAVWQPIARLKYYLGYSAAISLAVWTTFYGSTYGFVIHLIWGGALILLLTIKWPMVLQAFSFIQRR